jgi:hypothetical protein
MKREKPGAENILWHSSVARGVVGHFQRKNFRS